MSSVTPDRDEVAKGKYYNVTKRVSAGKGKGCPALGLGKTGSIGNIEKFYGIKCNSGIVWSARYHIRGERKDVEKWIKAQDDSKDKKKAALENLVTKSNWKDLTTVAGNTVNAQIEQLKQNSRDAREARKGQPAEELKFTIGQVFLLSRSSTIVVKKESSSKGKKAKKAYSPTVKIETYDVPIRTTRGGSLYEKFIKKAKANKVTEKEGGDPTYYWLSNPSKGILVKGSMGNFPTVKDDEDLRLRRGFLPKYEDAEGNVQPLAIYEGEDGYQFPVLVTSIDQLKALRKLDKKYAEEHEVDATLFDEEHVESDQWARTIEYMEKYLAKKYKGKPLKEKVQPKGDITKKAKKGKGKK